MGSPSRCGGDVFNGRASGRAQQRKDRFLLGALARRARLGRGCSSGGRVVRLDADGG